MTFRSGRHRQKLQRGRYGVLIQWAGGRGSRDLTAHRFNYINDYYWHSWNAALGSNNVHICWSLGYGYNYYSFSSLQLNVWKLILRHLSPGGSRSHLLPLSSKDFQLGHDDAMISLYQWPMISDQRARISDQWSVYISSSVLLALNTRSTCLLRPVGGRLIAPKGCEATETLRSSVSIATCVIIIVIICNAAAADLLIVTSPISA